MDGSADWGMIPFGALGEDHWFVRVPVRAGVVIQFVYERDIGESAGVSAILFQPDGGDVRDISGQVASQRVSSSIAEVYDFVVNGLLNDNVGSPATGKGAGVPPDPPPAPERETSSPEKDGLPISDLHGEEP